MNTIYGEKIIEIEGTERIFDEGETRVFQGRNAENEIGYYFQLRGSAEVNGPYPSYSSALEFVAGL